MGCSCSSSADKNDVRSRLKELENLLQEQQQEKCQLKFKLERITRAPQEYKNNNEDWNDDEYIFCNKIERLTNEKQQVFKTMLKERKKVSNLEDKVEEYKTQINEMEQEFNILRYKPILTGINIPKPIDNLPVYNSNNSKKRIKNNNASDADSSSEDEAILIAKQSALNLDIAFDPESEAVHVYSWIHGQKIDSKNKRAVTQLKQRLAGLLTSRSEEYRRILKHTYHDENGIELVKDIKAILIKGHTMEIINGLLMTRAQFDAILISQHVANWDIEPIADIICCRSMIQLHELYEAYKQKLKCDVKKQLQALAQKDKKKTLIKVIGGIFDLKRKEDPNVDMNKVNENLDFMLTSKHFKGDAKEKLVLIFTTNSIQFIKVLNDQFKLKSKDSLVVFIDKKLGPKSTAGHFCKTRILYALDTPDYYAQKIKKLGFQYKKNQKKISDIFIQRMETDLDLIQRTWTMRKYGDGKDLKEWIAHKSKGTNSGFFLQKMLVNCDRYALIPGATQRSKFQKIMM